MANDHLVLVTLALSPRRKRAPLRSRRYLCDIPEKRTKSPEVRRAQKKRRRRQRGMGRSSEKEENGRQKIGLVILLWSAALC